MCPGGPLVYKGGYHAWVQKNTVVFQGKARTARAFFRMSKTAKIKQKGIMFFEANNNMKKGYVFDLLSSTINMELG